MTTATAPRAGRRLSARNRRLIVAGVALVVLVVMLVSTRYVPAGAAAAGGPAAFDAAAYGKKQFPVQQKAIAAAAVEAPTLAAAVQDDPAAAAEEYGVSVNSGASTLVPVTFTGVVGEVPAAGYTPVQVEGLPEGTSVNVQLGPAVNGTDLRDATGKIELGQFENQIQFQDAGTAINSTMKSSVLTPAGAPDLEGKTVQVTGVFRLVNPELWNVTPSDLQVQQ